MYKNKIIWTVLIISLLIFSFYSFSLFSAKIDYNADVKPILNKKCIACHGGVKKKGGFSLLFEEEAKALLKSGKYAIVPFKPNQSELIKRITTTDEEERMPYKHDPLTKSEVKTLTDWIKQGAKWDIHWSYIPVKEPIIPKIKNNWTKNNIDAYVLDKLKETKLHTSSQADVTTLARRASLDIIGFQSPDSISKVYTSDPTDKTYEAYVDKLLASPHYGERWTGMWLDLARYADTKGYEKDDNRIIWRYKNWLINAFNADMPYDQFIKEQIAGDLLPNATDEQYLATAFHRNTMTNDEGGTDNEEFRTAAVIDRVNTTWETLMGTTFACVQCHAHPYDPIRHDEYYQFMAFFNNTRDADTPEEYPWIRHFKPEQKPKLDSLKTFLSKYTSENDVASIIRFIKTYAPAYYSMECDSMVNAALIDTKWLAMRQPSSARFPSIGTNSATKMIINQRAISPSGTVSFRLDHLNGPEIAKLHWNKPTNGFEKTEIDIQPLEGKHDIYLVFNTTAKIPFYQSAIIFDWIYFTHALPGAADKEYKKYTEDFWTLLNIKTDYTPIMLDNPDHMARTTRVFDRGNWLIKTDTVSQGTPHIFQAFPQNQPKNRLGLSAWLTDPKHPLVARVMVNRVWEQLWGTGIVETLEDFGSQGAGPQNQKLLDYLAYSFIHTHKWSVKSLIKEIMMSATYRQDSKLTEEGKQKDLFNRYLARGPRIRLSAEQLRDQALASCNFIDSIYEGKPVMPYQPEGVWQSPYNGKKWIKSQGKDQYRRAIYTFWKRTSAYPSMTNFDATGREVCLSRRIRTNTPLQALTLLNDSTIIDMAAVLTKQHESLSPEEAITTIYQKISAQKIDEERLQVLRKLYYESMINYLRLHDATESKAKAKAMNLVAVTIFNLDEVITKG